MIRQDYLIKAIAKRMKNDQFIDGDFLREENVSSQETLIFETVGEILEGYLRLPIEEKIRIQMLGNGTPNVIIAGFIEKTGMDNVLKKLKGINR